LIRQLIAGFKHAGLEKGDTVLIHSFNSIYYPCLVLAAIGSQASFCGTNPSYTSGELKHAFRSCQAKLIICDTDVLGENVTSAAKDCGILSSQIFVLNNISSSPQSEENHKGFSSWRTLLTHGEEDWFRFDDEDTCRNTNALLFFSSGTTGLPKATQLSHYNLIAQHVLYFEHHPRPYALRRLVALPMFHAATAPCTHFSSLKAGHVQVIMRRYEPTSCINLIEQHVLTDLMLVPPQITSLLALQMPIEQKMRKFRSVKQVVGGGAPMDAHTQNRFSELLPSDSPFTQIWAMTETSCMASNLPYPIKDDTGSVGRFAPNLDVKLLDDNGNDITAYDVPGELAIRGPTITRGYLGIPRDRDFDSEGYFRTGDILYCASATGLWYVVDRKKELIKVRGFQVAPAELEGVLLDHPGIADAAVIGIKDAAGTSEMPLAFVIKKDGASVDEMEVKQWVEEKLAKYKKLDGGVRFVKTLPKSASGKILKRILREEVKREGGAKL
jgi:4-coumarate--CoA ligase